MCHVGDNRAGSQSTETSMPMGCAHSGPCAQRGGERSPHSPRSPSASGTSAGTGAGDSQVQVRMNPSLFISYYRNICHQFICCRKIPTLQIISGNVLSLVLQSIAHKPVLASHHCTVHTFLTTCPQPQDALSELNPGVVRLRARRPRQLDKDSELPLAGSSSQIAKSSREAGS